MQAAVDLKALWNRVVDQVKMKVIHPTLWRALEMGVPITVENGQFVVGFSPADFHMSGYLTSADHRNAIENAIQQFAGQRLNLRVIEGTGPQDWETVKVKEAHAAAIKDAAYKRRQEERAVTRSWEGLLETIGRRYANTPMRQLPQRRAEYIEGIVAVISETMDELLPSGTVDELAERSLARVLEKAATLTEVPAAMIAMELRRYRGR